MLVKELVKRLKEYPQEDTIAYDLWQVEDVKCQAKSRGLTLSKEQCENVLERMEHRLDANYGLSWDVMDVHIDEEVN
jgi:hypothetical protein